MEVRSLAFFLTLSGGGGKVEHLGGEGVEVKHLIGVPNCHVLSSVCNESCVPSVCCAGGEYWNYACTYA